MKKRVEAERWLASPLLRCRQTARLLSGIDRPEEEWLRIIPDFRECDFGLFENKNYLELSDCREYQQWIDSNGTLPFPGGEDPAAFRERSCKAFEEVLAYLWKEDCQSAALVVHGGTIMSILERYARPAKSYYEWHIGNAEAYEVILEKEAWMREKSFFAGKIMEG